MSDHVLTTARPKGCAIAWATKTEIFVEIPSANPDHPPYIARYRKTAQGLAAALNILIEHEEPVLRQVPASHPAVLTAKRTTGGEAKPQKLRAGWASEEQREATRFLLKRRGII